MTIVPFIAYFNGDNQTVSFPMNIKKDLFFVTPNLTGLVP